MANSSRVSSAPSAALTSWRLGLLKYLPARFHARTNLRVHHRCSRKSRRMAMRSRVNEQNDIGRAEMSAWAAAITGGAAPGAGAATGMPSPTTSGGAAATMARTGGGSAATSFTAISNGGAGSTLSPGPRTGGGAAPGCHCKRSVAIALEALAVGEVGAEGEAGGTDGTAIVFAVSASRTVATRADDLAGGAAACKCGKWVAS